MSASSNFAQTPKLSGLGVARTVWALSTQDLPARDVKELITWLRANPDKGSLGTVGVGSPTHIWGIQFQNRTGIRLQFVPCMGNSPLAIIRWWG
jgi:tripartite-type tricarboxylate transporter receptor subunit TctC